MMIESDGMTRATWLLAYATFGLVGTGLGGIVFVWIQLNQERKQKRVENLERQIDMFESERFRKVRARLGDERLKGERLRDLEPGDPPKGCYEVLDFFEHIALLARERNLSIFGVWHSFGPWIGPVWSDFKEVIAIEQIHNKTTYCDFRWLVAKIEKVEKKEGGDFLKYEQDDLESHYIYERALMDSNVVGVRSRPTPRKRSKKASAPIPPTSTSSNENKVLELPDVNVRDKK
jgi:hypothetical protein